MDVDPKDQQTDDIIVPSKESPKSSSQTTKLQKVTKISSTKIVTGFQPPPEIAGNAHEVFLYDILGDWDEGKFTEEINKYMGSLLTATLKKQGKYLSAKATIVMRRSYMQALDNGEWMTTMNGRGYRWFPGSWTLQQRRKRDHFQLVIEDLPEEMTETYMIQDQKFCDNFKVKSFKIITSPNKVRKLVAFFESYGDQEKALRTDTFSLFNKGYRWINDHYQSKKKGATVKRSGPGARIQGSDQSKTKVKKSKEFSRKSKQHKEDIYKKAREFNYYFRPNLSELRSQGDTFGDRRIADEMLAMYMRRELEDETRRRKSEKKSKKGKGRSKFNKTK